MFSIFETPKGWSDPLGIETFMAEPMGDLSRLKKQPASMMTRMERMVLEIQADVCRALESEETDGTKFAVDCWMKKGHGGYGISCALEDGQVFERAGVNITLVHGNLPVKALEEMKPRQRKISQGELLPFSATGISAIVHPRNPMVPTIHFNYRYFEVTHTDGSIEWFFGGGADLTPYYLDEFDAVHFHRTLKDACDLSNKSYYPEFKKSCDDYFSIPHRSEKRGIGGIRFGNVTGPSQKEAFEFVKRCAEAIIPSYLPLVKKHKNDDYGRAERQWQLLRRGRYVEFNLIYDRGTRFGLLTPGIHIESVFMSMPLKAKWQYMDEPEQGSEEAKLVAVLKKPRDWLNIGE